MKMNDVYSLLVNRMASQANAQWQAEKRRLESECENLDTRLKNSRDCLATEGEIDQLNREVNQLEGVLDSLKQTVIDEISSLLAESDVLLRSHRFARINQVLNAAKWLLPVDEIHSRSPRDIERHLAENADILNAYREEMKQMLLSASERIASQQQCHDELRALKERSRLCDEQITDLQRSIRNEHHVSNEVLDSLARFEGDLSRLRAWMQQRRADAECERRWGTPEEAFSGIQLQAQLARSES